MKKPIPFLIVSLLIFSSWSCTKASEPRPPAAPTVAAPASAADAEAAIMQLEKEWVLAIEKKDTAALDRLLAADFVGTSPTAHTYTKEDAIGDIKDARYVVARMDLDEISANIYGDTAVSFTSQEEKSTYAGADTSGHYHFTDVWVKKDGRWQAVASHGTRYDQPSAREKSDK